jgi:hypothetical protein
MDHVPIVDIAFDLAGVTEKMPVRLYAPQQDQPNEDWSCSFEIGAPISVERTIYGVSSLQALMLGLKTLAVYLYGSEAYEKKEIGLYGEFGGHLTIPAPKECLDIAPYPF